MKTVFIPNFVVSARLAVNPQEMLHEISHRIGVPVEKIRVNPQYAHLKSKEPIEVVEIDEHIPLSLLNGLTASTREWAYMPCWYDS